MQANGNLCVLLFVLIIFRQCDLAAWQIIDFWLWTVGTQWICSRVTSRWLPFLVSHDKVLDVFVLSEIWHFLVIDKLLDTSIDTSLPGTYTIVSELNQGRSLVLTTFLILAFIDIEHDHAFTCRQVHALDLNRGEQRLYHDWSQLERIIFRPRAKSIHYQKRCSLQSGCECLGVAFGLLLEFDDIAG